jgi:hypothetical protein
MTPICIFLLYILAHFVYFLYTNDIHSHLLCELLLANSIKLRVKLGKVKIKLRISFLISTWYNSMAIGHGIEAPV